MLETVDLTRALDRDAYVREVTRRQIQLRELGYQVYLQKRPVVIAVRRLGCGGQGRRDQAHHRETRPARLCGLSDQRAARRRQDPPLPLPLLAAASGARADRHLRPVLVRPGAGGTGGRIRQAKRNGSGPSRRSTPSSGNCAISATILAKFWIHISREEQFRRFEERKAIGYKAWKLTDEDWRNRQKWGAYEEAVEEMLVKTSTRRRPGAWWKETTSTGRA